MKRGFQIKGLGEVAIRCHGIDAMVDFYRDIIGLEVEKDLRETSGIVFLRIGERLGGVGGHTTILALFKYDAVTRDMHPDNAGPPEAGARSSLHHLALTVEPTEQDAVIDWYTAHKVEHSIQHFGWIGWRGVFATDPEGNTVEIVAHHSDWLDI